jgi:hypothetical protein
MGSGVVKKGTGRFVARGGNAAAKLLSLVHSLNTQKLRRRIPSRRGA